MSDIAIKVEGLGKKYKIGSRKSGEFRESFGLLWNKFRNLRNRGFDESVSRINPSTPQLPNSPTHHSHDFWALKDISFEIKQGEAVGIIGRNAAGKSTLLKILSRITKPTTGRFEINGRVSSLLEVGTGFHKELTGRENIFLNGTILGMKRREIKAKFDEIVDFSGVEKFIDTPVKHYSSGMLVRLAFSVAAHLEPEILIIDEVLAVGDAEFQKKCLGKMEDVTGQGRTVLFVSHNLAAVSQLCQKGVLLRQGELVSYSGVNDVINAYISFSRKQAVNGALINLDLRKGDRRFQVERINLLNGNRRPVGIVKTGSEIIFEIVFNKKINPKEGFFRIDFAIDNEQDVRVAWFSTDAIRCAIEEEFEKLHLVIPKFQIGSGTYYLTFYATWNSQLADYIHQGFAFDVEEGDFFGTGKVIPKSQTNIYTEHQITLC